MKTFTTYFKFQNLELEIKGNEENILSIFFVNPFHSSQRMNEIEIGKTVIMRNCMIQLEEYFAEKRKIFSIPYELNGTDFQKRVSWKAKSDGTHESITD